MKVTFDYLPEFKRLAKILAKKYKSFESDYNTFLDELENNPFGGTPLGHHTYKTVWLFLLKEKVKAEGHVSSRTTSKEVLTAKLS